ncbi:DUF29 domain-containing protein [Desulfonema magnum]|uniref:DUF29 n=1 Tax=Desulfonema magnum TaxID=45655 RepID=A0A975GTZ3_9BACT|nr:DUF29 domain-containing protein [Desulfonema magnum]QTA92638.1 DUF29 [Desulfonema magnum]
MEASELYEKDFYIWTQKNARLIREGKFSETDMENIAEEIEAMGRRDKRELVSRLAVLLTHLLKWQYEADFRSKSWKSTIVTQRSEIDSLLQDSPSLRHKLNERIDSAYSRAKNAAAAETGLSVRTFPETCPYSQEEILDTDFLPKEI